MARRSPKKKLGGPAAPRAAKKPPPPVRSTGRAPGIASGRRLWIGGAVAVAVVIAVVAIARTHGSSSSRTPAAIPWSQLGALHSGAPPWDNGIAYLRDRLTPLGLSALGQEGSVLHIHQHLDLYVAGKKVTVPAGIGIDPSSFITEVHTHDTTGVIHVESPTQRSFVLGQFFGEWGVKLTAACVADHCGHLSWWVDGTKMTGNPAALVLKAHQEIAIAAGPPPLVVPKSYAFPAGE
ncbi:MAG: hypothetical protein ACYDCH_06690 [Gaiellaceae bacterium]